MALNETPSLAVDNRGLTRLARAARENSPEATTLAAQQFEALFTNMMLKSMRDATPSNGMLDNNQTRLYQQMLDQQMSQNLAARQSGGLTQMLVRQFNRQAGMTPAGAPQSAAPTALANNQPAAPNATPAAAPAVTPTAASVAARWNGLNLSRAATPAAALPAARIAPAARQDSPPALAANRPAANRDAPRHVQDFVDRVLPHAEEASRATGIPAQFLIAQAALETGWGRSELRDANGRGSFNLFNIKTGARWGGNAVEARTIEYRAGGPVRENARFRSYENYAAAFRDYADMLRNNPRYANVLNSRDASEFARQLAAAGYATDPDYAAKLERVIGGPSLTRALAQS
ncbi:MAG: flagellar assembly peptidoglycan hydrolase FlgJ [Rhodocyclaceae bacterium]|nr:flagellar assembly peptidoglycan hydrolase FlgJ [Rhodocyclaceae bacterium]MBX3670684.1 flagellar assembly peptidoglycan hydrolase FlgJ [Rhodocyclaceae bacterium]